MDFKHQRVVDSVAKRIIGLPYVPRDAMIVENIYIESEAYHVLRANTAHKLRS